MHKPVLVKEVVEFMHVKNQSHYIDATLGAGGHTLEIVKRGGVVLGIDADTTMLEIAKKNLAAFPDLITFANDNFRNIDHIAQKNNFTNIAGIIFDFGISSFHIDDFKRGFSFREKDSLLDMRLDPNSQSVKASDLLNVLREDQLKDLFANTLTEYEASKLSRKIVESRTENPIRTVEEFLRVINHSLSRDRSLNEATLPFLALRIAVNSELDTIKEALPKALSLLEPQGLLLVISFHSGEDRIVKFFFKDCQAKGLAHLITESPIIPEKEEIDTNMRSKSAKMRVLQKI